MRLPWKKQKGVVPETTEGLEEAKKAVEKSKRDVNRVDKLIGEVRPVMGALHERREANGFTAMFDRAMRGERGRS